MLARGGCFDSVLLEDAFDLAELPDWTGRTIIPDSWIVDEE